MGEPHLISWRASKQNTSVSWARRDSVSRQGQKSCLNSQTPGPSYRRWLRTATATPGQVQPAGPPTGVGLASPQNPEPISYNKPLLLSQPLLPCLPASILFSHSLLGINPRGMRAYVHIKICPWMFTAALFVNSQKLEPPTPSSRRERIHEWIHRLQYVSIQ